VQIKINLAQFRHGDGVYWEISHNNIHYGTGKNGDEMFFFFPLFVHFPYFLPV